MLTRKFYVEKCIWNITYRCAHYNPLRERAIGRCLVGFLHSGLRQLIFSLNDYGNGYKRVFWSSVCISLNSISMHTHVWENRCVGEHREHASWQGEQKWFHTVQCCGRDWGLYFLQLNHGGGKKKEANSDPQLDVIVGNGLPPSIYLVVLLFCFLAS